MSHDTAGVTNGSAAQPLARRVVSLVKRRVRDDQPAVALTEVSTIAGEMHARDADTTSPSDAITIALRHGDLMLIRHPTTGRRYLGPVTVATARFALGDDATPAAARAKARHEAEHHARKAVVGVWNTLAVTLADD